MTLERIIRIVAGSLVLVALALGAPRSPLFLSTYFLWIGVFVGANLFQSGFSNFCPLEKICNSLRHPERSEGSPCSGTH